jgi:Mlc titration factor MtfA (ptsG expression regulator)
MLGFLKRRRHETARARPLSEDERAIASRAVHLWRYLDDDDRRELEGDVQIFLAEKAFEGAQGLVVTAEMRLTIAAQACLLLLHRDTDVYAELETVILYPHPYVATATHREGPVVVTGPEVRLGESWTRGMVVLAWDEIARDVRSVHSGHSVVLHEFAHQLDAEDGAVDGAPRLESRGRYAGWAHVLGDEYRALGERLRDGLATDIDAYGATSPAEFFAVLTEEFFERGEVLRAHHPALYAELALFYRLDPVALMQASG